jgi:hypothetical protein
VNSNKVPEKYIKLFLDLSSNLEQSKLISSQIQNIIHIYEKIESRKINSKIINNFFALIVSTKKCSDYIKIKYGSEFFNEIKNLAEMELDSFKEIEDKNNDGNAFQGLTKHELIEYKIESGYGTAEDILEQNTPEEEKDEPNEWNY